MSDPTWTLIAVIVGGVLTTAGSVVVDWLKSRRDHRHAARERLRENLYVLQDDLNGVFDQIRVSVEAKMGTGAAYTQADSAALNNAIQRLVMQIVRIGDSPLDRHLTPVVVNLMKAHESDDPELAFHLFSDIRKDHMPAVFLRMEELLHTNVGVDHGTSKVPLPSVESDDPKNR